MRDQDKLAKLAVCIVLFILTVASQQWAPSLSPLIKGVVGSIQNSTTEAICLRSQTERPIRP